MKSYKEMSIEERIEAKREQCAGKRVQIMQWSDEIEKDVPVASGVIEDITRIEAPDLQDWLPSSSYNYDGKIYGYVVRLSTGEQQTCRASDLH